MTASTSRLAGMFDEEPTAEAGAAVQTPTPPAKAPAAKRERGAGKGAARREAPAPAPRAERTREQGKRSNPDYRQISLYMRADTHLAAGDRLRHRREFADFGELVESLVSAWLAKK